VLLPTAPMRRRRVPTGSRLHGGPGDGISGGLDAPEVPKTESPDPGLWGAGARALVPGRHVRGAHNAIIGGVVPKSPELPGNRSHCRVDNSRGLVLCERRIPAVPMPSAKMPVRSEP
jgi:hypothetical protein